MTEVHMYPDAVSHLPDPERQSEFYDGVTVKRGIAWVIDLVIILALAIPLAFFSIIGIFFIPVFILVVGFAYRVLTIAGGSATWGMRMMAIELRDAYGRRLDFGQAFLHTLGYTVTISTMLLQLISIGFMFGTPRGQGLSDMVLGTAMLNKRV